MPEPTVTAEQRLIAQRHADSGRVTWHFAAVDDCYHSTLCRLVLTGDLFQSTEPSTGQHPDCQACINAERSRAL